MAYVCHRVKTKYEIRFTLGFPFFIYNMKGSFINGLHKKKSKPIKLE